MRACLMPFQGRRASDEAMHCRAAVARRGLVGRKAPGPVQPTSRSKREACEGPPEDETPTASASVVARRRQNYGELRKPVDKGPRLWAAGSSASSSWDPRRSRGFRFETIRLQPFSIALETNGLYWHSVPFSSVPSVF